MATTKPKTFADRMRAEAREIDNQPWRFGQLMVRGALEEQLIAGMKAFAQLWFLEFTDEVDLLPSGYYRLKDVIDQQHLLFDEDAELEDEEDDDENGE